jgi:hypothetical protein
MRTYAGEVIRVARGHNTTTYRDHHGQPRQRH